MAIVAPDHVDLGRDAALVERTQAGEIEAFEDLYRRYFPRLRRFCLRYLSDPADAEEVAQEALARAYRAIATLGGDKRFYPWLSVIAKRLCVDHYRRTSRLELTADVENGWLEAAADEHIVDLTDHQLVRSALNALSPRHREVLERREVDGWSYQRIADAYGVSIGTVEQLLHRARKSLRKTFLDLDGESLGAAAGVPVLGWLSRRVASLRTAWQLRATKLEPLLTPLSARAAGLALMAGAAGIGGGALAGGATAAASEVPRPLLGQVKAATASAATVAATSHAGAAHLTAAGAGHGGAKIPPPSASTGGSLHYPGGITVQNSNGGGAGAKFPIDVFVLQPVHDANALVTQVSTSVQGSR